MKVAILGAGFSGMLAAYLLEKEGIEVTVYEKNDYLGGHCKTLVSKNEYTELGTVISFSKEIKELLIELQVSYKERFIYRNFLDEHYENVEHMSREDVVVLMDEIERLKDILEQYSEYLNDVNYGYIHSNLMVPLSTFLKQHNLKMICQVITPHLSAYGFGSIHEIQSYYVFKVFNIETLYSFIRGKKMLFIEKGTSELISKLSSKISDIRYSLEVINVEVFNDKVKVETPYDADYYDKVLITTKLPRNVIKDVLYNRLMEKIDTNPFIICVYEVEAKNLVTTYFKGNLGQKNKIQFFFTSRHNSRTILVAYAYGTLQKDLINNITKEIKKSGIHVKHIITTKQWYIFPHLKAGNLSQQFYEDIIKRQKVSNISLIGSLISKPVIDNLYVSVKNSIDEIIEGYNSNS